MESENAASCLRDQRVAAVAAAAAAAVVFVLTATVQSAAVPHSVHPGRCVSTSVWKIVAHVSARGTLVHVCTEQLGFRVRT